MPPPAQEERWAILAAIPNVAESKKAKRIFPPGADFSVARSELPRASVLTVPPHISLPACLGVYPYVAAADRSGLLLLCGTHPITSSSVTVSYHICDASTGQAVSLPEPPRAMAFYSGTIGLIVKGDGGCMVAGLQSEGDGGATLLSYKVGDGRRKWRERALTAGSPPPLPKDWFPEGVVSHGGMLWWVDLSYGLLAGDPFADEPELIHVPLPQVPDEIIPPGYSPVNRGTRSCVKVSGGRLRYVRIHGGLAVPVVSTWVLMASPWCPVGWEWSPDLSVPLAEVWVDETYLNTKLPLSIPAVAFLHPTNPDRVYFFLRSCIFAVDLQLRKVVEFNQFEMLDPPGEIGRKRSSRYVMRGSMILLQALGLTLYQHA